MEQKPAVSYTALGPQQQWDGACYQFCGDCDARGWGVCCVSTNAPYVLFGWNKARGFAEGALKWGITFFLLTFFGAVGYQLSQGGEMLLGECNEEGKSCDDGTIHGALAMSAIGGIIGIGCWIALSVLGCQNRIKLRQKFGLPGHPCTDCLLWFFCVPCSLCQETRTMMANNVENGVWMGPDVMMVPKGSAVV